MKSSAHFAPATTAEMGNEMLQRHMQATYLSGHHQDADLFGAGRAEGSESSKSDRPALPLKIPNQSVLLLNKANCELQMRSRIPAVRLLGFFEPNESIQQHVALLEKHDMDIYQAATFSYTLVPEKAYADPEEELSVVNSMLEQHTEMLEERKKQFDINVKERKMGDTDTTTPTAAPSDVPQIESQAGQACSRISLDQEVRSQKFAVVSVLRHSSEPAICGFGAFETEDLARHYIAETLSKHVTDHHLDIVPMYEWVHLDPVTMDDDRVPRQYRNRQLDEIMRTKRSQHQQVENYMKHCEEIGEAPKFREIDLDAPEGDDE